MVGCVNQGMTCYMNSLLQNLYHTNAFREAIYKIENDAKMPRALQRYFIIAKTCQVQYQR